MQRQFVPEFGGYNIRDTISPWASTPLWSEEAGQWTSVNVRISIFREFLGWWDQPSGGSSSRASCSRVPIATNQRPQVQDLPELTSWALTSNCSAAFVCSAHLSLGPCWILTGSSDEKWGHMIRDDWKQKHPSQKSSEKPLISLSLISSSILKAW